MRFFVSQKIAEFVQQYARKMGKPLCSDAFSGFIRYDPKKTEYHKDIREATEYLIGQVIPKVAQDLEELMLQGIEQGISADINIKKFMHSRGVNMRYHQESKIPFF